VIQAPGPPLPAALTSFEARSYYVASAEHYQAIAGRIAGALRDGSASFVLVTGDPPADPEALSEALRHVPGLAHAVIVISCGPDLKRDDVERVVCGSAWPLFVLYRFDRLSDGQIEEVCEGILRRGEDVGAVVLLTPIDFLARLEGPALRFLNERIAAQFRFDEVGDDETVAVLHNQLLSQRDRRIEARGFRRGILVGLAGSGVVIAASIGAFIVYSTAEQVCEAPANAGRGASANAQPQVPQPTGEAAANIVPERAAQDTETASALVAAAPLTSTPPLLVARIEDQPPTASPPLAPPRSAPRLSDAEIIGLVARGDTFFSAGDITSARLFYQRAAEADSGPAALQLGRTFDPMVLTRNGIRGVTADRAQALSWYRRARELGVSEAEQRIKVLETRQRD